MRLATLLLTLAIPLHAAADSTPAIEKVVRANLAASFTSHTKLEATATGDLVFVAAVDDGRTWWDDRCGDKFCNDDVLMFGGWMMIDMKLAPYKPRIVVDEGARIAWFAADLEFSGMLAAGANGDDEVKGTWPVRVTGIVVDDKGWKVAAEKFSLVISDAKLVAQDPDRESRESPGSIDGGAAKAIAGWFPRSLARNQSARAFAVNGTSPRDVARDKAAMTKLARAWDKLALAAKSVDVKLLAGGKVAWADVTATLPLKKKPGVKRLTVGIIAVPEGGGWRWVSLNWSPEVEPRDATH